MRPTSRRLTGKTAALSKGRRNPYFKAVASARLVGAGLALPSFFTRDKLPGQGKPSSYETRHCPSGVPKSLVKKHRLTAKHLAANQRNQKLSHSPVVDERRERIRAALLRHGFDMLAEEVAMRALGENPAHFQELLEALWETYQPGDAAQEGLVIQLAQATGLMNRALRMQEGYAVRVAQEVNSGRADRLHARMTRLTITAESLGRLVQSVARRHYVTPREDLEKMKSLHQEGVLKDMGEIALTLFSELQAPGTGPDGVDPQEQARNALCRIKEIFGLSGDCAPPPRLPPGFRPMQANQPTAQPGVAPDFCPAPFAPPTAPEQVAPPTEEVEEEEEEEEEEEQDERYPNITPAQWEAREGLRQLLENILTRYVEICGEQRKALLKESVKGPSPYERAAEIAPTHPNAMLMRRVHDSYFREVRRVTNLLLKLKRFEIKMATFRADRGENEVEEGRE